MTPDAYGPWDDDEDLPDEQDDTAQDDQGAVAEPEAPLPVYGTLDAFVEEVIANIYRRQVGDMATHRWDEQWWRYPEAVARLEALWRAWEHLRLDPALGTSVWFLHHADPHMRVLLDPEGPFRDAGSEAKATEPLPTVPAPAGLFTPVPCQRDQHSDA